MIRRVTSQLTIQVLIAVLIGAAVGYFRPQWGIALQPVADGFIKLVKVVVGPVVFLTIVAGIAGMRDLKRVGRVGLKALIYFEVATTLALAIGLVIAHLLKPGANVDHSQATAEAAAKYTSQAQTSTEFFLGIIPDSFLGPFVTGNSLQVLFLAVLVGIAVALMGSKGEWAVHGVEKLSELVFKIVAIVMRFAPLGAFAAMAFTIGKFGPNLLASLAKLMACIYLTMGLFIVLVLGTVLRLCGVSLWRYLVHIKDEILLVLGTSSSESALPRMIEKLQRSGCKPEVAKLVIPAGYSFNLDGTSIYLSMAVLFIAQAYGKELGLGEQLSVLGVLLLTSKGAAGVTGSGLITLAATLGAIHDDNIPVAGVVLLIGVDRFMSEARAITNLIGNGVAAIAVSKMEHSFDAKAFAAASHRPSSEILTVAVPPAV